MCVVKSSQDKVIRVKDYFLDVCFLEVDFFSREDPLDSLLLYTFAVSINELFKFSLILELENFQGLRNRKLRISLFCAFSNFESDCLRYSVQERVEVIERAFFFKLENSSVISYITFQLLIPSSIASFKSNT